MKVFLVCAALSATVALALGSPQMGAPARAQGQWQKYQDAHFHLSLDYPGGWDVHVDEHSILVRNGDNSTFALVENFRPQKDDTPEDFVDSLPSTESQFFRSAHVDNAFTEPAKNGDEKEESGVGVISFAGSRGPAQARVLCRIYPSGGILFGIAAPRGQLEASRATLIRILQSINFGAAVARGGNRQVASHGDEGGGTPIAASAPVGLDSTGAVKYRHWVDPKEGAFSYDVPVGWKVDGGTYRYEPLDYRPSIIVRSPHDEMAIMIGDAAIPGFDLPSQNWTRLGFHDGAVQNVVGKPRFFMHYMSAEEFNHWYFDNMLSKSVDNLEPGPTKEHPDIAEKLMDQARNTPGLHGTVVDSVATTTFSGRSKANGRDISGNLITYTNEFIGNAMGDGNWQAHVSMVVYATGGAKSEARKETVAAVLKHMNQSFKMSPEWIAQQNQRANSYLQANQVAVNNAIAASKASMASMARSHQTYMAAQDERRTQMMGSFNARMAAKSDMTRKTMNYSLDQTDVTNGSGTSWKVPSGYSSYYHNARTGTIVGTNGPSNPGPDFAPLSQF